MLPDCFRDSVTVSPEPSDDTPTGIPWEQAAAAAEGSRGSICNVARSISGEVYVPLRTPSRMLSQLDRHSVSSLSTVSMRLSGIRRTTVRSPYEPVSEGRPLARGRNTLSDTRSRGNKLYSLCTPLLVNNRFFVRVVRWFFGSYFCNRQPLSKTIIDIENKVLNGIM